MKALLFLFLLLFPVCLAAQLTDAYTNSTEKIFYDTNRIIVYWHKRDTTVWIKTLMVKLEAFQKENKYASLEDIPLRFVQDYSFREVKPSDVGTCTLPCYPSLKPILQSRITQEIERKKRGIDERNRLIDSLFPPKRVVKIPKAR